MTRGVRPRRGRPPLAVIVGIGLADRRAGEQTLTFEPADDGKFRDRETGSVWTIERLGWSRVEGTIRGHSIGRCA